MEYTVDTVGIIGHKKKVDPDRRFSTKNPRDLAHACEDFTIRIIW